MISTDMLYEALLQVLPDDYPVKFSYVDLASGDSNTIKVTKNTAAMYFRSAGNPSARDVTSGDYGQEMLRLVMNVFTDRGEAGVLAGLDYCARVCKALDHVFNRQFNVKGAKVFIADCQKIGNYQYVGPTKQGVASFSLNYLVKYY